MTRLLEVATKTALEQAALPLAAIVYLDIQDDPLFIWSGIGDLAFAPAETGDPSLDGFNFTGTGTLIEVSSSSEGVGGSDALEIGLPGVDLAEPMLRQLISNKKRWQFRRAVVWMIALDATTNAIAGKPFRIKTGRMDKMPLTENRGQGVVKCRIEGQQSYGNQPLATRYSEQRDINPNDTSQKYVHSLANMNAKIGTASMPGGVSGGTMGGGVGGSRGFGFRGNGTQVR